MIFAAFFVGSSCVSSDVRVEQASEPIETAALPAADFWSAMENLAFEALAGLSVTTEEAAYARALEAVTQGDWDEAIVLLEELVAYRSDDRVGSFSFDLLAKLYFEEGRYADCLALLESGSAGEEDAEALSMVRAFAGFPAEVRSEPDTAAAVSLFFDGWPRVEVSVNGIVCRFIVDTGAGMSVISSRVAEAAGIEGADAQAEAGTSTSIRIGARPAYVRDFAVGGIRASNHPVLIVDSRDLEPRILGIRVMRIDGIVGWNFLRDYRARFDYRNRTVSFGPSQPVSGIRRNFFWLGYPIVALRAENGLSLYFGLDTGSRETTVTGRLIQRTGLEANASRSGFRGGAGGFERMGYSVLRNWTVRLNGFRLSFANVRAEEFESLSFFPMDGILGNDIGEDGALVFDFPAGAFGLELDS